MGHKSLKKHSHVHNKSQSHQFIVNKCIPDTQFLTSLATRNFNSVAVSTVSRERKAVSDTSDKKALQFYLTGRSRPTLPSKHKHITTKSL